MSRNSDSFIPFALPSIGREEEDAVLSVLRSGWLTTGRETLEFEKEFAGFIGVKHAVALNSATAGLHLALEAIGTGPGDRIITTPYTFTSTAEVIRYSGADPVFVDIEEDSFNINPDLVQKALSKEKKSCSAVIPVHIGGEPCGINEISEIAAKYGIPVIEDAAHAFPAKTGGRWIGTIGDAGVFSFYATKTITTGEGGMLVTDNEKIAKRASVMRIHGIDREIWDRYNAPNKASWKYDVIDAGYKYNISDIASAMGRAQLKKACTFLEKRRKTAERYLKAFAPYDFLTLPPSPENHAWHLFILQINPDLLTISRDEFINELAAEGIGTSVHYTPLHLFSYYKKLYGFKPEDFPAALAKYRKAFSIPIYPGLDDDQISRIINTVIKTGLKRYKGSIYG